MRPTVPSGDRGQQGLRRQAARGSERVPGHAAPGSGCAACIACYHVYRMQQSEEGVYCMRKAEEGDNARRQTARPLALALALGVNHCRFLASLTSLQGCKRGGGCIGTGGGYPHPPCDIPSGCCSFTGPWTVTRSSLRMLRRVAAFCRPLRPVLLLVSFPRSRSPVVGVLGLC